MNKWKLDLLKRIQDLKIWKYLNMRVLMKLSQLILERRERQKHTKRHLPKILTTLTLMNLEQKLIQKKWRPIYEVIDEAYIDDCKIFPGDFIRECKKIQTKHFIYHAR